MMHWLLIVATFNTVSGGDVTSITVNRFDSEIECKSAAQIVVQVTPDLLADIQATTNGRVYPDKWNWAGVPTVRQIKNSRAVCKELKP